MKEITIIRPEKLRRPQFWILNPSLGECSIPKFSYPIYSKYILLKTYLHLKPIKTITIPDDIEPLIEIIYDGTTDVSFLEHGREEWEEALRNAQEKQETEDENKQLAAKYKLIAEPEEEDFFEELTVYYEEDSKDAQASFQSLTRITRPSVTLVGLYAKDEVHYLDDNFTLPISLTKMLNREEEIEILDHSLQVSNYHVYHHFMNEKNSIPRSWAKSALIRDIHPVLLSRDEKIDEYFFETDKNINFMNKELGLYIKYKEE